MLFSSRQHQCALFCTRTKAHFRRVHCLESKFNSYSIFKSPLMSLTLCLLTHIYYFEFLIHGVLLFKATDPHIIGLVGKVSTHRWFLNGNQFSVITQAYVGFEKVSIWNECCPQSKEKVHLIFIDKSKKLLSCSE
jgi:hypothetical protein